MHTRFTNRDWWPNQLDLRVLHAQSGLSDPMGEAFDYAKEFKSLDLKAVIKDLQALMTDSGRLWPLRRADDPHGMAQCWHIPHC
jgi:catalase-peroxidase